MSVGHLLLGAAIGLVLATFTAPVGVSGAVFLLPVQLSVLHVPSPSVTPTNLLFNVVSAPGALWRYRQQGQLGGPLTRLLLAGTVPGVVAGSVIRVLVVPDGAAFRIVAGCVLLGVGGWLLVRTALRTRTVEAPRSVARPLRPPTIVAAALVVGVVGGVYGIGGGSILGPVLVGSGVSVTVVAPAALASTFGTSLVGAVTYGLLSLTADGSIAPDWLLGAACGLGGLVGGYVGARLQPRLPETGLRLLLGSAAVAVAVVYFGQAFG